MKLLLQIILFFFTWFSSIATFSALKIVVPTHTTIFQKTDNVNHSEKVKIGISNFARSSIEEAQNLNTTFNQNIFSLLNYLKGENSCTLEFQKRRTRNQLTVSDYSSNESLSKLDNRTCNEFVILVSGAGNFLDDIYNTQKSIINTWKNNIATATNIRKGNFGEIASDAFLAEKNFQPLHTRLQSIDAPTRQGIDGVFKKGNEYFIVESKYSGTATLSNTADGKQMSDAWINGSNRLQNAVGPTVFQDINAVGYRRLLAEVAPDGTIIYKELDASASVIGTFTP